MPSPASSRAPGSSGTSFQSGAPPRASRGDLEQVAGQAEAGDVGQRVHAAMAAEPRPGVLSRVVVSIIAA